MANILCYAESSANVEQAKGGRGEVTLLSLLQAYEVVLRKENIVPEEDTQCAYIAQLAAALCRVLVDVCLVM
jgi:hypothetical protein